MYSKRRLRVCLPELNDPEKVKLYTKSQSKYEHLDGYSFVHRAKVILSGFGLEGIGLDRPLSNLSSGQKSKVALAGILLKGVDLLLLDEPTNNLDLPALIWLEDFLQKSGRRLLFRTIVDFLTGLSERYSNLIGTRTHLHVTRGYIQ